MVWTKSYLQKCLEILWRDFFSFLSLKQGRSKAVSVMKRIWLGSPAETQETFKSSADVPEPATDQDRMKCKRRHSLFLILLFIFPFLSWQALSEHKYEIYGANRLTDALEHSLKQVPVFRRGLCSLFCLELYF